MIIITNKKYQPIKVFINDKETVIIPAKESKKLNIKKASEHMSDLEREGLIAIKTLKDEVKS